MTTPAIERVHTARSQALEHLLEAVADLEAGRASCAIYQVMEAEDSLGALRRWLEINTDANEHVIE